MQKIKLSNTSKMPCKSWGIPAELCIKGSRMAKIKGSTCHKCYALKGAYSWPKVKNAYSTRLDVFNENSEQWINNMLYTLDKEKNDYFRWFDSGDLQSIEMLDCIVRIAYNRPGIKFWLPTREKSFLLKYFRTHRKPSNLTIRLSDLYIDKDDKLPKTLKQAGILTSGVSQDESKVNCHSYNQHGKCLECRACWDSKNKITYLQH